MFSATRNVLIGCHPKRQQFQRPSGELDHWQDLLIRREVLKRFKDDSDVDYYTTDILDAGAPDIFKETNSYTKQHHEFFDVIFLPDCGGPWYDAQTITVNPVIPLYELIRRVMTMLKPSGYLYAGKLLNEVGKPLSDTNLSSQLVKRTEKISKNQFSAVVEDIELSENKTYRHVIFRKNY